MSEAATEYRLPSALISRADLARLVREVETVDTDIESQRVRNRGTETAVRMPVTSRSLGDFLEQNEIDIADDQTRMGLKEQLRRLKDKAPVVHMTFATDADPDFLGKLVDWIRTEVHPQALITVGLQPSIVGGVYIRTPNQVHDFTVKTLLAGKRDIITRELEGLL